MVQPYVCINTLSSTQGSDDIHVEWYVGGATTVDETFLSFHTVPIDKTQQKSNPQQLENYLSDWRSYLSDMDTVMSTKIIASPTFSGHSRWKKVQNSSQDHSQSDKNNQWHKILPNYEHNDPLKPSNVFSSSVNSGKKLPSPDTYWLVAWAKVDQSYGKSNQGSGSPSGAPQSYVSNLRTNSDWTKTLRYNDKGQKVERIVKGRVWWPSDPIIVQIDNNGKLTIDSVVVHCHWWEPITLSTVSPTVTRTVSSTVSSTVSTTVSTTVAATERKKETLFLRKQSTNQDVQRQITDKILDQKHAKNMMRFAVVELQHSAVYVLALAALLFALIVLKKIKCRSISRVEHSTVVGNKHSVVGNSVDNSYSGDKLKERNSNILRTILESPFRRNNNYSALNQSEPDKEALVRTIRNSNSNSNSNKQ